MEYSGSHRAAYWRFWGNSGIWRGAFLTTSVLTLLFILAAWKVVPESEKGARQRLPYRRLLLLGTSVSLVGASGQVDDLVLRGGWIVGGVLCLILTLRLDRVENNLFPRRVLSLFAPVGTAYWVFLLLSAAYTPLTIFLPLALSQIYKLEPLWIGYVLTVFSIAWTVGSLGTAGWNDKWTRIVCASGLAITAVSILGISITLGNGSIWTLTVLVTFAGVGVGMTNVHSISGPRRSRRITDGLYVPAMVVDRDRLWRGDRWNDSQCCWSCRRDRPETVERALSWVFALGALVPLAEASVSFECISLNRGQDMNATQEYLYWPTVAIFRSISDKVPVRGEFCPGKFL